MKRKIYSLAVLMMVVMLLVACTTNSAAESVSIEDLGSFSQALRAAGATIESSETVQQVFFTVEGRILNQADIRMCKIKPIGKGQDEDASTGSQQQRPYPARVNQFAAAELEGKGQHCQRPDDAANQLKIVPEEFSVKAGAG